MSNKIIQLEAELGPRGALLPQYKNRSKLRSWTQEKLGCKYNDIVPYSASFLTRAYNDLAGGILDDIRRDILGRKMFTPPSPFPTPSPNEMPDLLGEGKKALDGNGLDGGEGKGGEPGKDKDLEVKVAVVPQKDADALAALKSIAGVSEEELAKASKKIEEKLDKKIDERISKIERPQVQIVVKPGSGEPPKELGVQHEMLPLLIAALNSGCHAALVGTAGSGKTTGAYTAANALNDKFYCQSFSATTTKADLLGFIDANGNYRTTPFREAFEKGGVWCGDEFDAGNANASLVLNAALANGLCAFPDKPQGVERHPDFKVVICMNTWGQGANRLFVGRNQIDAATLDRFVYIGWDIDESLEAAIIGIEEGRPKKKLLGGAVPSKGEWLNTCRIARKAADALAIRHLVTPRAVIHGIKLMEGGVSAKYAEEMVIWRGLERDQRSRLETEMQKMIKEGVK